LLNPTCVRHTKTKGERGTVTKVPYIYGTPQWTTQKLYIPEEPKNQPPLKEQTENQVPEHLKSPKTHYSSRTEGVWKPQWLCCKGETFE